MGQRKAFENALLADRVASRFATEFPTDEALKKYLKEHPDADRSNHSVKKSEKGDGAKGKDDGAKDEAKRIGVVPTVHKQLKKIVDYDINGEKARLSKANTLDKIKPILDRSHKKLKSFVDLASKIKLTEAGDSNAAKNLAHTLRDAKDLLQKIDSRPSAPEGSKGADQARTDASDLLGAFDALAWEVPIQRVWK